MFSLSRNLNPDQQGQRTSYIWPRVCRERASGSQLLDQIHLIYTRASSDSTPTRSPSILAGITTWTQSIIYIITYAFHTEESTTRHAHATPKNTPLPSHPHIPPPHTKKLKSTTQPQNHHSQPHIIQLPTPKHICSTHHSNTIKTPKH
jgi:hypothetical protein